MLSPLSNNFGFYKVGNQIFDRKIQALRYATQTNQMPSWHFHSEIYKLQDWTSPPIESLESVYQQRAKDLRERYDYLVLSFSGGSDSWSVFNAFKTSGQHLDEILVRWPNKASSGKYHVNANLFNASNILSEWDLTLLPLLKEIEKSMPKTKITIVDWSDQLLQKEMIDDDWTNLIPQEYLNVGAVFKWSVISESEQRAIDSGLKTCFISGIDKPQLWIDQGKVYCYFLDKLANGFYNPYMAFLQGRHCEHFYWSHLFPKVTVTQAKHIFSNLKVTPAVQDLIDKSKPNNPENKKIWNKWTRSIIYPEYNNMNLFQADKSYTNLYDEVDNWILKLSDLRFTDSWKWGVKNIIKSIDPKFFNKKNDEILGFSGFIDGEYYLGSVR